MLSRLISHIETLSRIIVVNIKKVLFLRYFLEFKKVKFSVNISLKSELIGKAFIELGEGVFIDGYSFISASPRGLRIGNDSHIYRNSIIKCQGGKIEIGSNCSVQSFCFLGGLGNIEIGNGVRIAPGAKVYSYEHGYIDIAIPMYKQRIVPKKVVIEDDVWIGSNAVITGGLRVGKGSIVGAGSVVTHSVEPFSVVGGVPAKLIKKRI